MMTTVNSACRSACQIAWLALLLGGVGCGLGPLPGAPTQPMLPLLLPLATGNEWVYQVRNAEGEVSRLTMRVKGERYIASRGMDATIVEESGGVPGAASLEAGTDLVAYYLRDGFLFRSPWVIPRESGFDDRGAELGDERLLPLDLEHDPKWESIYALFDFGSRPVYQLHASSRLVSQAESVTVPAGVFRRCARVETIVSAETPNAPAGRTIVHVYVEWYSPRIGLVKSESFVTEGDARLEVGGAELVGLRIVDRSSGQEQR